MSLQKFSPTYRSVLVLSFLLVGLSHGKALAQTSAPVILIQPQTKQISIGYTASFFVWVTNRTPYPKVQWIKDSLAIPDATNSAFTVSGATAYVIYSITNIQSSNAGTYSVVLSNSVGSTQSSNAILRVLPPYTFITMAGLGAVSGTNDGDGSAARFNGPRHVAMNSEGDFFLTDYANGSIRKITAAGTVTTLTAHDDLGNNFTLGHPHGIAIDSSNNLFVTLLLSHTIVKITPDGLATTIAGSGAISISDGIGKAASFSFPLGITTDGGGNLFVTDNTAIRKISPVGINWVVTTIAGAPGAPGFADGTNTDAKFNFPDGLAVDGSGNIFVADEKNCRIRKITPIGTNWVVTTFAGSGLAAVSDGAGTNASFYYPSSIALNTNGEFYITDQDQGSTGVGAIRKLANDGTNWFARTIGGSPFLSGAGTNDGTGIAARFHGSHGVVLDSWGNLVIVEWENHTIRKGWMTGTTPATLFNSLIAASNQLQLDFLVTTGSPTNFTLFQADQLDGTWRSIPNGILSTNVPGLFYRFIAPLGSEASGFYRLQQQ